jgi:outer membrane immunogenic protein
MFNSNKSLLTWLGTVRGRAGYLIRDDILLYGTAGMAYGNLTASGASWLAITVDEQALAALGQYDSTDIGWTAGAGLEYAVAKNWSLKAEWLYVGFGDKTYGISPIPFAATYGFNATVNNDIQLIKTGINYRIDFADTTARVTAKY